MKSGQEIIVCVKEYEQDETDRREQVPTQHSIGMELLKSALMNECGLDIREDFNIVKASGGKPYLRGLPIYYNISHCKGVVVCALAPCPVGVDVEGARPISEALIKKVCTAREQAYVLEDSRQERFLKLWTLKESYLKMTGEGIVRDLRSVEFQLVEENAKEDGTAWRGPGEICCNEAGSFYQKKIKQNYILSICVEKACESIKIKYCK